jgi:hypothetical protein
MGFSWGTGAARDARGAEWRWPVGVTTVPVPVAAVQVYAQAIAEHAALLGDHVPLGRPGCAESIANLRAIAADMDGWCR